MSGMTRWRCRRGVLELDTLFFNFFDTQYATLDEATKDCFDSLLELPDPVLLGWLVQGKPCTAPKFVYLIDKIKWALK